MIGVRIWLFFFTIGLSNIALAAPETANENISLLILPFSNATPDQGYNYLAESMNDLLLPCVAGDRVQVVDRRTSDVRNAEKVLKAKAVYSGNVIAADYLLRGSLVQTGRVLKLNTLVFDVATTELVFAKKLVLEGLDIDAASCQQWRKGLVQATRAEKKFILKTEVFPEREHLLTESIARLNNGEAAVAMSNLLRLSYEYPGEAGIEYWLAKAFFQAGLYDLAKIQITQYISFHPDTDQVDELAGILVRIKTPDGGGQ